MSQAEPLHLSTISLLCPSLLHLLLAALTFPYLLWCSKCDWFTSWEGTPQVHYFHPCRANVPGMSMGSPVGSR